MDDYTLLEQEYLTKQFIENNKEIMFSDIQDNKQWDFKEASNKFRTIRDIREFILQRIYSNRGISIPSKEQERNSSESNKKRILEFI